jgi:ubiquinone/menaquinone biosynthesis C-methylase UbiE
MAEQAFNFTGEAPKNYDHYLGPFLFEPSSLIMAAQVPGNYSGQVLELAAGTGRLTRHLVRRLSDPSLLTATDISQDMLEIAKKKVDQDEVKYQVEDMQALSFPDKSFDLIVCQYGVMFPPDKEKAFKEMYRVLKPGGAVLFSTWEDTEKVPFFRLVFNETLLPFFTAPDKEKYVVPFHMHDEGKLENLMTQAGFQDTSVERKIFKGTSPSPGDLVNGFIYRHQLSNEIRDQEPEAVERIAAYLENEIGERFGSSPVTCELVAYIGKGKKGQ